MQLELLSLWDPTPLNILITHLDKTARQALEGMWVHFGRDADELEYMLEHCNIV